MTLEPLIAGVRAGDRRAIGRAISLAERLGPEGRELVAALHPDTGRAWRVGITGPPGAGKSTLISGLAGLLRRAGRSVAVVSVNPTSPFTRGAVLGDRIRLADHFLDPGVFIRSMASRGHQGGLAEATADAVLVLDAAGFDVVLVETVGSGQNEVEVQSLAETVVLALMPGSGDGVQAIKAGLMEIPDVLAVSKADRPGADVLVSELANALTLVPAGPWEPPIVRVAALDGTGLEELWEAVERHRAFLAGEGRLEARRRDGLARQLRALAADRLARRVEAAADPAFVDGLIDDVLARRVRPVGRGRPRPGPRRPRRRRRLVVAQDQGPDDDDQHQDRDRDPDDQRPAGGLARLTPPVGLAVLAQVAGHVDADLHDHAHDGDREADQDDPGGHRAVMPPPPPRGARPRPGSCAPRTRCPGRPPSPCRRC